MSKHNNNDKKGFASNPEGINRGGRPKGAKKTPSSGRRDTKLENYSAMAVETLKNLMTNNKKKLGISEDVSPTVRLNASKEIIARSKELEKEQGENANNTANQPNKPTFSAVPVKQVNSSK